MASALENIALVTSRLESNEFGIRRLRATFRDPELERSFVEARTRDDVRATWLALLLGGLAYAGAGATDAGVFGPTAADSLPLVWILRATGVALCLGGAATVRGRGTVAAAHVWATVGMLGTLLTYSGIAYLQETLVGPSDLRFVSCIFALLAFIFFPLPLLQSLAMAAAMTVNVTVLTAMIGKDSALDTQRLVALMVTFSVAGASFSTANHRARRKEFWLRRRREEVLADLSREVEQRRAAERELQAHKESLEATVLARTEELRRRERELVSAQRMEATGRLAGGLAHDFNNLLVVVIGNTELALELPGLPEPVPELLGDVLGAAQRGSKQARDLLLFSRRDVSAFTPRSPRSLVEQMAGILRAAIGSRAELELRLAPETPDVYGSSGSLE